MKNTPKDIPMPLVASDSEKDGGAKFFGRMLLAFLLLPIVYLFWADKMPFTFFELWKTSGTLGDWLTAGAPIFIWGCTLTILLNLFRSSTLRGEYFDVDFGEMALVGTLRSLFAGFVEEVGARWLIFLWAIVVVRVINFCFFGFLGFGIAEWMHLHIFGPIANWTTLGYLEPWLLHHETGWAIGAGILGANATFRDGHKYQGFLGIVNSWFAGMYFFWLTFTFGLWAAIVVHFMYDFLLLALLGPFIAHLKHGR